MKFKLEKLFLVLLIGVCFYTHQTNYWREVWLDKWALLMGSCVLFLGLKLSQKYNVFVGIMATIALLSALWVFGWRQSYPYVTLDVFIALGKTAAYAYCALITCLFVLTTFDEEDFKTQELFFLIVCAINSIAIIYEAVRHIPATARGGFFGNPSMSGCLIAVTYPFFFKDRINKLNEKSIFNALLLCVPIVAIILTVSSQPIGVLVLVLCSWYAANNKNQTNKILTVIGVSSCIGLLILWAGSDSNNQVFDSSGRTRIWQMALTWFFVHGHTLTGQGTGTSQIILPLLQRDALKPDQLAGAVDWWLWMHSDWLQLLLENGLIGFLAGILLYVVALIESYSKSPILFSAVMGVGGMALFNFPAHWPLHAWTVIVILAMTFDKKYLRGKYDI